MIKVACETYTWQMPGEIYKSRLGHIIEVMHKAGFAGIEAETSFFGPLSDPNRMKEVLQKNNMELTALCHVEDWKNNKESSEEKARADQWIEYLSHFPNSIYLLVQMPGNDRNDLEKRQSSLLTCVNAIAERAHDHGIVCSYHPNSPEGSIYRTREDYDVLLNGLNIKHIGYTPDLGHIAKGGMDPLAIVTEYRDLINLVHYKDMYANGEWAPTGRGIIAMKEVTSYLKNTSFKGWIVMEDECDRAINDPDGLTIDDGAYIQKELVPLLNR